MLIILKWGVLLSLFTCVLSLLFLILRTLSFERKSYYSEPSAGGAAGIFYAFGRGMTPWEKESAGKHLTTYLAGIAFHLATFLALFYLLMMLPAWSLPLTLIWVLRVVVLIGILSGSGLLLKRIYSPLMKSISSADDFVSNILVNLFLLFSLITSWTEEFKVFFFLISIVMFFYIPMSKIRHCFFFFYTRILFGFFYGRRGALPPHRRQART